jgi:hypothetical protein
MQDFTVPGFGTPKAAMFIVTRANVSGAADDHASIMKGLTDGVRDRCVVNSVEHGVGSENTYRWMVNDACILFMDPTDGSSAGYATFDSWITNGVRVNWQEAPAGDWLITCVLLGGSDLSPYVGTVVCSGGTTLNVTAPGADTDAAFFISSFAADSTAISGSSSANATFGFGMFAKDSGAANHRTCITWGAADAQSSGDPYTVSRVNDVLNNIFQGSSFGRRLCSQITNGFSLVATAVGGMTAYYLALNFNDNYEATLFTIDSPGSGSEVITAPGFKPQCLFMFGSMVPNSDTIYQDDDASTFAIGVSDATNSYCHSITDDDAAATIDAQSKAHTLAIEVPEQAGGTGDAAELTSFDTLGFTLNFTDALQDGFYGWLVIEEGEGIVITVTLNSAYGAEGDGPLSFPSDASGGAYGSAGTGILTEAYG